MTEHNRHSGVTTFGDKLIRHEFRHTKSPTFGLAFGGACDVEIDGQMCGFPENAFVHWIRDVTHTDKNADHNPNGEHF